MRHINLTILFCLGVAAFAQQVAFDYDHSAHFSAYKTYQWVDYQKVQVGNQILDQEIKRAVDAQLAAKGLQRVEGGADLLVGYEAAISQEKEFNSFGGWGGPGSWIGPWGGGGNTRITSSTIEVGKLVIGLFDPANKHLVWRGSASRTLNISKDPDKNYRTLERAMAKLFRNYPPQVGKN